MWSLQHSLSSHQYWQTSVPQRDHSWCQGISFVRSDEILGENSIYNKLGVAGIKADKTNKEHPAHDEPMIGGIISKEALWSCTTCMACMEVCPVDIEHV